MSKRDTTTGENAKDNYCFYYLHTNGELIHKGISYDTTSFEESDFVVKWWKIDLSNRSDVYRMLIFASILGAKPERVQELRETWGMNNEDLGIFLERVGLKIRVVDDIFHVNDIEGNDWPGSDEDLFKATILFFKQEIVRRENVHVNIREKHVEKNLEVKINIKDTGINQYKTLSSIVEQLEKCEYQTPDGFHDLKMNAAFIALKEMAKVAIPSQNGFTVNW